MRDGRLTLVVFQSDKLGVCCEGRTSLGDHRTAEAILRRAERDLGIGSRARLGCGPLFNRQQQFTARLRF